MLTSNVSTRIKQLLLAEPDMSTNELKDVLDHEGFKASRMLVAFVATQWRHSLCVLEERGLVRQPRARNGDARATGAQPRPMHRPRSRAEPRRRRRRSWLEQAWWDRSDADD
jgi:hypothetical protein